MGRKVSVWLSDEALSILDTVIKEKKMTNSGRANVSNTLDGLVRTYGKDYVQLLRHIQQAVRRYTTGKFAPQRKPINIEEYETFKSMEGYAEKLGVSDE